MIVWLGGGREGRVENGRGGLCVREGEALRGKEGPIKVNHLHFTDWITL